MTEWGYRQWVRPRESTPKGPLIEAAAGRHHPDFIDDEADRPVDMPGMFAHADVEVHIFTQINTDSPFLWLVFGVHGASRTGSSGERLVNMLQQFLGP